MLVYIAGNPTLSFILFGIFDYATFPLVASIVATHIGRHGDGTYSHFIPFMARF